MPPTTKPALVLVCSSTDQVGELSRLRSWWSSQHRHWFAPDSVTVRALLADEPWTPDPASGVRRLRSLRHLIGPTTGLVVADTGWSGAAAVALARRHRVPSLVFEGIAPLERSRSRRVVRGLADRVIVQWPEPAQDLRIVHVGGLT